MSGQAMYMQDAVVQVALLIQVSKVLANLPLSRLVGDMSRAIHIERHLIRGFAAAVLKGAYTIQNHVASLLTNTSTARLTDTCRWQDQCPDLKDYILMTYFRQTLQHHVMPARR